MWVLFISTRARGKVQFQREVKPVQGKPTAQMFLTSPVILSWVMEGLGACSHTQLPFGSPCWPGTTAILLQEKGPSLQLSTHISCSQPNQQIKLKTIPSPPVMLSYFMPHPMDVQQICLRVLMAAMQLWHHFFPNKPMSCEGCITKTWILPTEESRTRASIENGGHSYFANLRLWDTGWRKALALP